MKKIDNITPIHNYNSKLLIGDAHEIILRMKNFIDKDGHPFWNNDGDYYNQIEDVIKSTNYKYFCMPHSGGAFHQLFFTYKNNLIDGFYIDTASAEFRLEPWVPESFYSKQHKDVLYENIKQSINKSKPISIFECSSNKILLCQTYNEVLFYVDIKDKEKAIIDYKNKVVSTIIEELEEYCFEPKVKFLNYMSNEKNFTYDFYIDDTPFKKFEVYKIFFEKQNVDEFANYYATYYADEKNLNKKKYLDKKSKAQVKEWTESEFGRYGINTEKILGKNFSDKGTAPIEKYERYVKDNKYCMGYYFKGI